MLNIVFLVMLSMAVLPPMVGVTGNKEQKERKPAKVLKTGAKETISRNFFDDIGGIAVYSYNSESSQLGMPEKRKLIKFNIREPKEIETVLKAFDYEETDARNMLIVPDAYIFFRDSSGNDQNVVQGKIVGGWQFIMLGDNWSELYPITDSGIELLRSKVKPYPKYIKNQP